MGIERSFDKVRLVVASLRNPSFPPSLMEEGLVELFGPMDFRGPELEFGYSGYYQAEMGERLLRGFYSFSRLVDPADLASVKRGSDALEQKWAQGGGRPVNLDPGLLGLGKFILATTKDRAHRIPLRDGIYAELTLYFEGGAWKALPWTYPDWQSPEYCSVLMEIRQLLKADLKRGQAIRA